MSQNQPCDVIKMRKMRGKVGKKTSKKRWIIPRFYDVTWLIFETLCPATQKKKQSNFISLTDRQTYKMDIVILVYIFIKINEINLI